MNYWFLASSILTGIAFFVHIIQGSKETKILRVSEGSKQSYLQAFAAFQLVSVDLLLLALVLGWMTLNPHLDIIRTLGPILLIWLMGWLVAWITSLLLSRGGKAYFWKLPQWILFFVLCILIFFGIYS
ncbi:MAG: hypothetical protein AAF694_22570 [Bacteroidota bacterium]